MNLSAPAVDWMEFIEVVVLMREDVDALARDLGAVSEGIIQAKEIIRKAVVEIARIERVLENKEQLLMTEN